MQIIRTKQLGALIALLIVIGLAPASISAAPDGDQRAPELPSPLCDRLKVEAGNKVHSHVYATGTQIYRWDGVSWVFVEPEGTCISFVERVSLLAPACPFVDGDFSRIEVRPAVAESIKPPESPTGLGCQIVLDKFIISFSHGSL